MPAKIFSIEAREVGGARFALNYKHAGRSGIQRISCDLSQAGLLQLVLFAEALSLHQRFGRPEAPDLSTDGLIISFDAARGDLNVQRQAGYSKQTARLAVEVFLSGMAEMTDLCITGAETSKHGPALKRLLADTAAPEGLAQDLGQDEADLAMHQLREIAFLLLVQDTSARKSGLARKLRGKKSQDQARSAVNALVLELAAELVAVSACVPSGDPGTPLERRAGC
ncbi:hypothetical protein [Leisingera daeponensis]|uniref:hypothetical protein n=1 Tax=Leisingera daeponensis TaxID=405746 RepID=UPI001C957048|nr:hypothetical protein [Leisingera daeponensis]MBY6059348.1 hypothetical protein [Leisingera daeponensis]